MGTCFLDLQQILFFSMYFDLHKVEQLLLVGASYKHPVDYSTLTFVPVLHGTESWKRHCVEIPQASKR